MNIVMVASEMAPFAKTGGLADVIGSLPYALCKRGHQVSVFIPLYRSMLPSSEETILQGSFILGTHPISYSIVRIEAPQPHGWGHNNPPSRKATEGYPLSSIHDLMVRQAHHPEQSRRTSVLFERRRIKKEDRVQVYAIRKDEYFDRTYIYGSPEQDYEDNAERFIFFCKAVIHAMHQLSLKPQLIHAHDWQTALIPVYSKLQSSTESSARPPVVLTIHNVAYQGLFSQQDFAFTNLPEHLFTPNGLEFYGRLNLLKGGIIFADAVTTVSRHYAQEIQTAEYGYGLDGVLRTRTKQIRGILNGVDYSTWDPTKDPHLPQNYGKTKIEGKAICKQHLKSQFKFEQNDQPILGIVSRFAQQKGIDLILNAIPKMIEKGARFVVLGNGDKNYEARFMELASKYSNHIGLKIGFNESLAHLIYAGSDFLLMPSLYEPCGLSQLYALKYGTIPIVRATGGLDDTVEQWNSKTRQGTGLKFQKAEIHELMKAFEKALCIYKTPQDFLSIRQNAMNADFSWEKSVIEYETLYQTLQNA